MKDKYTQAAHTIKDRLLSRKISTGLSSQAIKLVSALDALSNVFNNRNPSDTEAGHIKKVVAQARRLQDVLRLAREQIINTQSLEFDSIEGQIKAKLNLVENHYAGEIRATFRQMDTTQKNTLVEQLIDSGDGPTLAAILNAPPLLSGIDKTLQFAYISKFEAKHASNLVASRDNLTQTMLDLSTLMSSVERATEGYVDPVRMAQIESQERAANEANDAFSRSLQN